MNQLNYDETDLDKRLEILNNIVTVEEPLTKTRRTHPFLEEWFYDCYNPNIKQSSFLSEEIYFFQKLETMASYVLYADKKPENLVKPQTQASRDKKHTSIEKMQENYEDEQPLNNNTMTQYTNTKTVITDEDRDRIPELRAMENWINSAKRELETSLAANNALRVSQLKRMISENRSDQKIIKEQYDKPIHFTRLNFTSTEYTFDEDTGYFNNDEYHLVSNNQIDLGNPKHIVQLLNHYSQLKHQHYDEPQSDMRYILDTLDNLIEQTGFKEVFAALITRRIDGASYQDISDELMAQYGIQLSVAYLSSTFASHIPKQIAKTYEQSYEDWYYTYKAKGDYKTCSNPHCLQPNKLRLDKYFRKDKKAKDGLSSVCKECRNQE